MLNEQKTSTPRSVHYVDHIWNLDTFLCNFVTFQLISGWLCEELASGAIIDKSVLSRENDPTSDQRV